jgi:hypothetical protein
MTNRVWCEIAIPTSRHGGMCFQDRERQRRDRRWPRRQLAPSSQLPVAILLSISCSAPTPASTAIARCDEILLAKVEAVLESFPTEEREKIRRDLDGSRHDWWTDPKRAEVREIVERVGPVRSIIRLEVGGDRGGGYGALWLVDGATGRLEIVSDAETNRVTDGVVSAEKWARLERALARLNDARSEIAVYHEAADAPVFFVSVVSPTAEFATVAEYKFEATQSIQLVAEIYRASALKTIPREFVSFLNND